MKRAVQQEGLELHSILFLMRHLSDGVLFFCYTRFNDEH